MTNFLTRRTGPKVTTIVSILALLVFMPLLLFGTTQIITLFTRASGTPANIIVDTKVPLETIQTNFYHAFAQGGEEAGDMLVPVLPELKALNPKVIRIDHIYDHYDVVGKSGDTLTFNFDKLDAAANSILATGAKPNLALSYMPSVIAKDGVIINIPNNWDDWALVVQKTIEHYSGKGAKNIGGIYYEVWNEPDLAQFGSWRYAGDKNYITLYHYAAVGAGHAQNVNQFFLGGPATTGLYQQWISALIRSGNRVDFLSWHTYQRDPKRFNDDQQNIATWLLPYPGYALIPKLITEFGFTGDKSTGYATTYAAAHTAAVVRQLISGGPTYALSFQPKDGPGQEAGNGWGLITHETNGKKKKPRYFIYNFLDDMAGTRLALSGEGSWVTGYASTKNNVIRVMLVNFDVSGTHVETVSVTFNSLDPGTYKFRQHVFLGSDTTLTETVPADTFSTKILMPTSSVVILELTKQ